MRQNGKYIYSEEKRLKLSNYFYYKKLSKSQNLKQIKKS